MNRPDYERLLHNNITQSYRKSNIDLKADIDSEAKEIAVSLSLEDRIQSMSKKEAFIALKDHKDNFQNNKPCRLINPAKSEIGHISKVMLEEAVKDVTEATGPGGYSTFRWLHMANPGNSPTHPLPEEENQNFDPFSKKTEALTTHF